MEVKMYYRFFRIFLVFTLCSTSFFSFGSASEWIDFEVKNGKVIVPAKIEGIKVKAVLDTGLKKHYISDSFLAKHPISERKGQSITIKDTTTEKNKFLYNQVQLDIFGFENKLDTMIPTSVSEGDIVLGSGFFFNFVMQFDFSNQRLRFLERGSINLKEVENIEMRLHRQSALPIVKVKLDNKKSVWVILSTGSKEGLRLDRLVVESEGWDKSLPSQSIEITEINGKQSYDIMNLPKVEFGPFSIDEVSTAFSKKGAKFQLLDNNSFTGSYMKGMDVKGVLGYDILQHFLITVDFKNGRMHVGIPE